MIKSLLLDLRDSPGGLLSDVLRTADLFPKYGLIVRTSGRTEEQNRSFLAHPPDTWGGLPLAVLVNGGTAGGGEILAAALQHHDRATILGTATVGKGRETTAEDCGLIQLGTCDGLPEHRFR